MNKALGKNFVLTRTNRRVVTEDEQFIYNEQDIHRNKFVLHRNIRCMFFWTRKHAPKTKGTDHMTFSDRLDAKKKKKKNDGKTLRGNEWWNIN